MKNYLFLLLLFCANIALGQTNSARPDSLSKYKLDELLSTGKYDLYELDLNRDRLKDKALSSSKDAGQDLYFFLQDEKGAYHCALKSTNFSHDNSFEIWDVRLEDGYVVVEATLMSTGAEQDFYYIRYDGERWILDHSKSIWTDKLKYPFTTTHSSQDFNIDMANVQEIYDNY